MVATDGEPIAAMVRSSDHWITNAAKGAETDVFELDDRARELVEAASDAVGGGLLGVDLMETGDEYTVHEVNHTVEFKALDSAVETDVASTVVDWLEESNRRGRRRTRGDHLMAVDTEAGGSDAASGETVTASIIGGSGFVGGELLRLLATPTSRSSRSRAGRKPARASAPSIPLRGTDLRFTEPDDPASVDVLFAATPTASR